jgi:hypothetical protein
MPVDREREGEDADNHQERERFYQEIARHWLTPFQR